MRRNRKIVFLGVGLLIVGLALLAADWQIKVSRMEAIAYVATTTKTTSSSVTIGSTQIPFPDPSIARDAVMSYIKAKHPSTASFMVDLVWSGGSKPYPLGQLGAGRYEYLSGGWNVSITYPVVLNLPYAVTVSLMGPPYWVLWKGSYQNGVVVEENYSFVSNLLTSTSGLVIVTATSTSTPLAKVAEEHDWLLYLSIILAVAGASLVAFHFLSRRAKPSRRQHKR